MILVTAGTMLPFDRLIQVMDRWTELHPGEDVFAQIGEAGTYVPSHMRWTRLVTPTEFNDLVRDCALIVAHAGTGSFFLAAEMSKPIVMLPRLAANREHTTDHQVHTARWLNDKPGVHVAFTDAELPGAIDRALGRNGEVASQFTPFAPEPFLKQIRSFLVAER